MPEVLLWILAFACGVCVVGGVVVYAAAEAIDSLLDVEDELQ